MADYLIPVGIYMIGVAVGILMGRASMKGRLRAAEDLMAAVLARYNRLTDRDEKGRFVRREP